MPPPLPPPWQEYKHDDGRKYYHNPETRATSWHRPAPAQPPMPPAPPARARSRAEILRRASCMAGRPGGGDGGEAVEFECTVHRNQCGLGIEVSDDNRILSVHPEGGAAASRAGLQARTPPSAPPRPQAPRAAPPTHRTLPPLAAPTAPPPPRPVLSIATPCRHPMCSNVLALHAHAMSMSM